MILGHNFDLSVFVHSGIQPQLRLDISVKHFDTGRPVKKGREIKFERQNSDETKCWRAA
ncbi:predicted protein [Sclerotinia sclerotiorum 1980 UF-70]|uniref:Uncharacterized protein n=1 Tax=Sclerotinia sclerotiorum (strain ATCC 18683 / 1980 / Ss-1) TaxID=665079 RepID=A7ETM8_SCLS1|nr:predicted protein [Sclerotinia sclerotiorum 1980 UF-70]EDN92820.1 predicted protein [Sclerotinia sclerotiorum 1980 UF-70]